MRAARVRVCDDDDECDGVCEGGGAMDGFIMQGNVESCSRALQTGLFSDGTRRIPGHFFQVKKKIIFNVYY